VEKFGEFTCFKHLAKKFWRMNRFNQKVIIVSRNLDSFSLVNQEWFAKFVKLSHYTVRNLTNEEIMYNGCPRGC